MRRPKKRSNRRLQLESLENRLAMATLYVAPTGSDSNSGATDAPLQTLQRAANLVQAGDTVIVRAGNYQGFDFRRDGTADKRITFRAEKGVQITSPNSRTPDGINLEGADYVTIEGFTVNNMPRTGIRSVENHHVTIRNNSADSNGWWGILTGNSDDLLIENNVMSRSEIEHGIYTSGGSARPVIRNNIVWGNSRNGIHMNGGVVGALVEGNVIYDNGVTGGSAINCDGTRDSLFQNNLLYNNHASGISLYRINSSLPATGNRVINNTIVMANDARWALNIQNASTNNTVSNNILYNNSPRGSIDISSDSRSGFKSDYNVVMSRFASSGSNYTLDQWRSSTGQDRNSIIATPDQLFENVAANDYHLKAGSPAIDKGTATSAPNTDYDGTARPSGAGFDIGADERAVLIPTPTPGMKYVSTTGNDANDGSATSPWRTLQKAANSALPGDTILVRAGNYAGFHMIRDGEADKRITFRGEQGATINARNANTADGINLEGADFVTVEGFAINNLPRAGIRSVNNQGVVLRNNTADMNAQWGILTGFSDDLVIEGNTISRSQSQTGIHISNSGDRPVVRNNKIWGNYRHGLFLDADATSGGDGIISGALIEANTIYENGRGGGSAIDADGVQNSLFQNNILYNNHGTGVALYRTYGGGASTGNKVINNTVVNAADGQWALSLQKGSANSTVLNNVLYSRSTTRGSMNVSADSRTGLNSNYNVVMSRFTTDGTSNITLSQWRSTTGQDRNSFVATPTQLFVNAAANDYHLSATSPALNKGTTTNAPAKDFEGTARPSGAGIDIGADERLITSPIVSNVAPKLEGAGTVGYTLNSAAIVVAGSVTLRDPDTVSYNGGSLNVRITSGVDAGNRLELGGLFRISDGNVNLWDGRTIGTISGDMQSSLTVTFNQNATRYWTEQLVKSIRFRTMESTSTAARTLEFQVNDGAGGLSNKLTATVNVQL